jgi:hypothetical protein
MLIDGHCLLFVAESGIKRWLAQIEASLAGALLFTIAGIWRGTVAKGLLG